MGLDRGENSQVGAVGWADVVAADCRSRRLGRNTLGEWIRLGDWVEKGEEERKRRNWAERGRVGL